VAQLQSCCIAENCPLDPSAECGVYPDDGVTLVPVNITALAIVGGDGMGDGSNATAGNTSVNAAGRRSTGVVGVLVVAVLAWFE